mmetsp:Transcript_89334/g.276511  ORF Transcript_89334/g.276511 Transcript_89334/m.276511 type:complete len:581 (+) Transcript_89334:648-2390(+)
MKAISSGSGTLERLTSHEGALWRGVWNRGLPLLRCGNHATWPDGRCGRGCTSWRGQAGSLGEAGAGAGTAGAVAGCTARVTLSTAVTARAAPPGAPAQRILQGGAHRLPEARRDALQDGPRFGLGAPRANSLEDAAQQVRREQAARSLLGGSPPVRPVAEGKRGADLGLRQAALDDGGVHRGARSSGRAALAVQEVQDHDRASEVPRLDAARDEAGPDHARGHHAVHVPHLAGDEVAGEVQAASAREELHQDGEGDAAGPDAALPHLGEQAQAQLQVAGLHAALQQRVVHDLVALELAGLELLGQPHRLVEFAIAAVALDQRAERDQVRANACRRHLLEHLGSPVQIVCSDTSVDEAIEDDNIAQHTLGDHLAMKPTSCRGILRLGKALDEGGIEDRVPVEALLLHQREDVKRLVKVATLHAGVQHATVSDGVGLEAFAAHLGPGLQHLLDVASPPIGLDDGAVGDCGTPDAVLTHPLQGGLKPRHVAHPAEHVEKRIHQHLVDILGLRLQEVLHERHAARSTPLVTTVGDALGEDGHGVLVSPKASALHLLQDVPGLVEMRRSCSCCCVHKEVEGRLVR